MKPVVLVVMDGVGLRGEEEGNAFRQADTPNLDSLMDDHVELEAHGPAVGLPEGYQGNSEVGHLHLGAGRRVPQRLTRINQAVKDGELGQKESLKQALERAEENGSSVHFAGIISDGGIHGHIDHLEALLEAASRYDLEKVWVHCFTDGRDVDPKSADRYLSRVEDWCGEYGAEIATVAGRYYAMDRDQNWDRTGEAYRAIARAEGFKFEDPREAVEETYGNGDYDYFVTPAANECYEGMNSDAELVFFNFRADRMRQLAEAFLDDGFEEFDNPVRPHVTSMFPYRRGFDAATVFEKKAVEETLGEKVEDAGMTQLRVTESQKIPHVTYFFNGQRELQFSGEERRFVESDKIKEYSERPEMHADDITDVLVEEIEEGEHDFMLLNFPNGDLVGHTGNLEASVTAVETVDRNVGRIVEAVDGTDYALLVTADHGNCEDMGTEDEPNTSHTTNPVPLVAVNCDIDPDFEQKELWEVENVVEDLLGL